MVLKLDIEDDLIFVEVGQEEGFIQQKLAFFQCSPFHRVGVEELVYSIGHGAWLVPSAEPDVLCSETMDEELRKKLIPYIIKAAKEQGIDVV